MDDRSQVSPRNPDGSRDHRPVSGPHIGRVRLTPTMLLLVIAVVGPILFLVYAITVRDATQIPLLVAGLVVLGIVFAALAMTGAVRTYQAAAEGRNGRAFLNAFLGGVAGIVALGCFAVAIVGTLAYRAP